MHETEYRQNREKEKTQQKKVMHLWE